MNAGPRRLPLSIGGLPLESDPAKSRPPVSKSERAARAAAVSIVRGQAPPVDTATAADSDETDGRRLRRERNREAVVQALLDLFREGNLDPSTDEIAARSGVSARSLFRYFDDVSDLSHAAITRQQLDIIPLLAVAAEPYHPTLVKVNALVQQRRAIYELVGIVGVAARVRAPFQPAVAERLDDGRRLFRRQVHTLFARELEAAGAGADALLTGLDLLTSFESWRLLRDEQRLTPEVAAERLAGALARLLGT